MKTMSRRFMLAALVSMSNFLMGADLYASDKILQARVESAMREEMKSQRIPGMAIAVVKHGKVVVAKAFGEANLEHHVPVKLETVFQSGSTGKQFTAVAVMLQVEDGKLNLDDKIRKFFPDAPESWDAITVRNLLTHTSGIPDYEGTGTLDLHKDYTDEELAKTAYGLKLEFPAGSRYNYSNTGYVLLGILVNKVSGKFYGDVLAERVFKPLGMKTARSISDADIVPNRADGYQMVDDVVKHQDWVSPSLNRTADGSLYVTLADYIAWDKGLREGKILSAKSWEAVYTPVRLTSGKTFPYGFGWAIDKDGGQLRIHHSGSWQGFKAYISRWISSDLTVIVFANIAQAKVGVIVDRIGEIYDPKLKKAKLVPHPDPEPAVGKRLLSLLVAARDKNLPSAEFAYLGESFVVSEASYYSDLLAGIAEPSRLEFLERVERGDDRLYTYDVNFGVKSFRVQLGIAPDNKISVFDITKK